MSAKAQTIEAQKIEPGKAPAAPVKAVALDKPIAPDKSVSPAKKKSRVEHSGVLIVGYGVLVPLVAMAMVMVMTYPNAGTDAVLKVEITYAAALLSFLGGIRWGIALMAGAEHIHFRPLALVTLSMPLAWTILFLSPAIALGALMAGYLMICFGERIGKVSPVPIWYHRLLVPFTVLAEISLGLSLLILLNT